jgi:FKBP-type peptidyl-prolyl cis-trans isomerase
MRIGLAGVLLFLLAISTCAAQSDTIVTASGLKYVILQPGQGPRAAKGARVAVNFTGKFKNGHIFDSSALDKRPLKLRLGKGELIPAWEEILLLMQTGTKLVMVVPAAMGYSTSGLLTDDDHYKVPPNTDLIFEMELVSFKK